MSLCSFATQGERSWPGPEVLELPFPQARNVIGFVAYCGTFEVRDGQAVHHTEFHILPGLNSSVMARSVVLDGDRLILGTPLGAHFEWQRSTKESRTPDSDLGQALLGTWRLVSNQFDVNGTLIKPLGDDPHGYLVYTQDGHVIVQMGTRAERSWRGPEVFELPTAQIVAALGFIAHSGTFEVPDGQVEHHMEIHFIPSVTGRVERRSVVLDGDRLILGLPNGAQTEWQRVHTEKETR
jgi:hypothetical protein